MHVSDLIPKRCPKKNIGLRPRLSAHPAPIGMKNKDVIVSDIDRPAPSLCVNALT